MAGAPAMRTVVALSANSRMRCRQPPARGAERVVVADDANFDDGPGALAGLRHGGDGARLGAPPFGIGGVFDIGACEDEPRRAVSAATRGSSYVPAPGRLGDGAE